ncbi:MAG: protein kinase domain-containing protein [Planctomycetota bacterium]|jgi:serine/threonine-protein kinase
MGLSEGQQLGSYTVIDPLGVGGMGEVYRATDTKLDREVAIKVLPDAMAASPDRVALFDREAKVLASLNHPHIAAIHGFEESQGKRFLVLELVEGLTLADRLKQGPIPLEEALDIARQIAEALEAAHEHGVIHRDLKPANIKVTPDGDVKVLDFGLAKVFDEEHADADPEHSPTMLTDVTGAGAILGTAPYMSPEQARGRPVDKRSDIWSFGCVLYESLTGDSMFRGETITDSLGAVLHKQPEWERLPEGTPPTVQLLLRRCLAKDVKRRMRDIGDARIELEAAIADPTSSALGLAAGAIQAEAGGRSKHPAALILLSCLLSGLVVAATMWALLDESDRSIASSQIDRSVSKSPLAIEGYENQARGNIAVLSPDGRRIAYRQGDRIWVQELDQWAPRMLPGTEDANGLFWSYDSRRIAFGSNDKRILFKINIDGGAPTVLTPYPEGFEYGRNGRGRGAWTTEGIVFAGGLNLGLWQVSEHGENPHALIQPQEDEAEFWFPCPLPDGHGVLVVLREPDGGVVKDSIALVQRGELKVIWQPVAGEIAWPEYSNSGHILFTLNQTLTGDEIWALPFSLQEVETTAAPFRVDQGSRPSVGANGALVYRKSGGGLQANWRPVWVDEKGGIETIGSLSYRNMEYLSLSPDASQLLVSGSSSMNNASDSVWLFDMDQGGQAAPVSFPPDDARDIGVAWLPDGERFLFTRTSPKEADFAGSNVDENRSVLMLARVDGLEEPRELLSIKNSDPLFDLSRDGKRLVFSHMLEGEDGDGVSYVSLESMEAELKPVLIRKSSSRLHSPRISPDGKLLAYASGESGSYEIYLTTLPSGQERFPVFVKGVPKGWQRILTAQTSESDDRYVIVRNWFEEFK